MLDVQEAIRLVLDQSRRLEPERVALDEAAGRVLAEDVVSDVDVPPFDRAAMDGFALRAEDAESPPTTLRVVGEVAAGQVPTFRIRKGETARISTGAPLPGGADSVQQLEKARDEGDRVILFEPVEKGRNVAPMGEELARGDVALPTDTLVNPVAIGVLATVGRTDVLVYGSPRVGILATGSELVDISRKPRAGQIRNSNSPAIFSAVAGMGGRPEMLGVAPDDEVSLDRKVEEGLACDVLIITGGISVGPHDLVEASLRRFGVTVHFNRVAMKPGKPATFGSHRGGLVFALPGNPLSALVTFSVLLAPALRTMLGLPRPRGVHVKALLEEGLQREASRTGYLPARTTWEGEGCSVRRIRIHGSADLASTSSINSLLICPRDVEEFKAGTRMECLLLPDWLLSGA